jgi:iron-sulfur cluster assembly protein
MDGLRHRHEAPSSSAGRRDPQESSFLAITMTISLTESAANRVKTFLSARGHGVGLKLGVRKTGCSGFAYVINYADEASPGDVMFEDRGVKVFVDPGSLSMLDGTIVDFIKQGLNEAFRFRNPNVKGECGCGESFSV